MKDITLTIQETLTIIETISHIPTTQLLAKRVNDKMHAPYLPAPVHNGYAEIAAAIGIHGEVSLPNILERIRSLKTLLEEKSKEARATMLAFEDYKRATPGLGSVVSAEVMAKMGYNRMRDSRDYLKKETERLYEVIKKQVEDRTAILRASGLNESDSLEQVLSVMDYRKAVTSTADKLAEDSDLDGAQFIVRQADKLNEAQNKIARIHTLAMHSNSSTLQAIKEIIENGN